MTPLREVTAHMHDEGGGASRSTDPASGTSSATDVSLREYLTALINAVELRSEQRFETMKEEVAAAFHASQEAISKAEAATEKRFESVNEFRAALADQQQTQVSKTELSALTQRLQSSIDRNREDLISLSKRVDLREGADAGARLTFGQFIAIGSVVVAAIGVLVVLANYFAGH